LLSALGVEFRIASLEEVVQCAPGPDVEGLTAIIAEEELGRASDLARSRATTISRLFAHFARALVFPMQGTRAGTDALSEWSGGTVRIKRLHPGQGAYSVAAADFCGPFAGLTVDPPKAADLCGLTCEDMPVPVEHFVRVGDLSALARIRLPYTELFVSAGGEVFDTESKVCRNISASECFAALVPLVLYLRQCEIVRWQSPRQWANVVIDDPNLTMRYGFVDFPALAQCVDELCCAVSIAFIPWNFERTSSEVVKLMRCRWPKLSLAIHGCDHTRSEFSTETPAQAQQLIGMSVDRMHRLASRTGLRYDSVIVFPQGEFSASAMRALRQSEIRAAVNTELNDQRTGRGVRAGELLKPALTCYSGFPLFLRRRAEEPIANFALDLLLNKPCLVVTHHEYYRDGMRRLRSLVHALNALAPGLTWTNLESIVSRSVLVRLNRDQTTDIYLFSAFTEYVGEECSRRLQFSKSEPLTGKSFQPVVGSEPVSCSLQDGLLSFSCYRKPAEPVIIQVAISPLDYAPAMRNAVTRRLAVAARRHLSELRDNHAMKSASMTAAFTIARRVIRNGAIRVGGWKQ
jgi:hypothetical protein